MLLYHHCRSLESVVFGEVKSNPRYFDSYLKNAYLWLKDEVGFNPLFLSVGTTDEDIHMTGYQNQWARIIGTKIVERRKNGTYIQKNILSKKGEFSNDVLFSFEDVDGVFMDYMNWHRVFNIGYKNQYITNYEKRLIFKPSWLKSRWLRKAREESHSVQLVTASLTLSDAQRILVRNKVTKKFLENMGFRNVEVKRIIISN